MFNINFTDDWIRIADPGVLEATSPPTEAQPLP